MFGEIWFHSRVFGRFFLIHVLVSIASLFPGLVSAALVLEVGFDSASLDVQASSVSGVNVALAGRRSWTSPTRAPFWGTMYFRVRGTQNVRPVFRTYPRTFLGTLSASHRFLYSYDQVRWIPFDRNGGDRENFYFYNNQAFTQDVVYVSSSLPYPVSRTTSKVTEWLTSPHVRAAPSANTLGILGSSAAGVNELGQAVPAQPVYALQIHDDSQGPATNEILLVAGSHSGEVYGNWVLEGLMEWLLSTTDPRAIELRRSHRFLLYPSVNPGGRFGGFYRSAAEFPSRDYNRFWHQTTGMTELELVMDSMLADLEHAMVAMLDFHSHMTAGPDMAMLRSPNTGLFTSALDRWDPNLGGGTYTFASAPVGALNKLSLDPNGWNVDFSAVLEPCPGNSVGTYLEFGRNIGLALSLRLGGEAAFQRFAMVPESNGVGAPFQSTSRLQWLGMLHRSYQIQAAPAMTGPWSLVADLPGQRVWQSWSLSNLPAGQAGDAQQFFRLIESPQSFP